MLSLIRIVIHLATIASQEIISVSMTVFAIVSNSASLILDVKMLSKMPYKDETFTFNLIVMMPFITLLVLKLSCAS